MRRSSGPLPITGSGFSLLLSHDWLTDRMSGTHMFNIVSTMSFDPSGSSMSAITTAVPQTGVRRDAGPVRG
jgi:hypothetical protein